MIGPFVGRVDHQLLADQVGGRAPGPVFHVFDAGDD
jgi:hypothetical protein